MNKRSPSRLKLHRQTVRRLTPAALEQAAGAYFPTTLCPRTLDSCVGCFPTAACPSLGCPTFFGCDTIETCRGCPR